MDKESIIKTIKYEKLSTEDLTELTWLLNKDQYKERPVTIEEFYSSDDFVHKKWPNIFPLWKQTLKEIFPTPFNAPYNEILISAAAGSGKTVTATISVLYDLYKLGCLIDPCKYYGLTPDTMIIMAIFSATGSTAAVNWNDITTGIEACPWIMEKLIDKRGLEKKHGSITPVEIMKGLYIQTGSKFQHSMGKAIFDGLMDEAAFGGANMKESQKTYNELSSRMKTRFSTYSETGNLPGHLFLISSPKEAGDFMQHRIEESKKADARFTKIMMNISSWDSNPNNDSDDKFTVFVGNESKEPCIYEPDEDVPIEEMDDLIYPPMRYYEEFKKDLLISIMNYGGITTTSDMALFKSPILLNSVFVLDNPFHKDVIELPFATSEKTLMDFCNLEYFRDIRHPEYNRFIHIDAAYSTNTLDVYGLAAGYCIEKENIEFSNEQNVNINESDIFSKKDREYFVDFAVGITAPHGQEVNLNKVQDFIEYLIRNCNYPVACITADQFQSKQTLQNLQNKGFNTDYVSVDRSRDPYLFLRYLIHNKQILIAKNEYLKLELRKLRDDGKKIDHPVACFTGDTKIQLVDGRSVSINDLLLEQQYKQNWVYTFNEQTKKIEPKKIKNIWQTKITKDLVKVTLDNGEVITCTPDHRFMLRDGSYEEIQNLTPGTSLMPLYTKVANNGLKGYRLYYEPMEDEWHYEHRIFGNPTKERNIVHHCNYNKLDNTPTNLKPVTKEEHTTIHNNQTRDYNKISNSVKQWHERIKGTEEQKQISKKISQKVIDSLTDEQKQKRQNRLNYIKGLEQHFNVVYNNLTEHEQRCLSAQYTRLINPEIDKHHSEALKQAHKNGKYAHRRGVPLNRIWVTNGIEDKYITKDSTIPDGFKPGRCKVGKNHKIVSIEYITKPCRVYDLEIEDNHNFALAAGVFVHNCHKDVADAVAGAIWKCANSTDIMNKGKIVSAVLNPDNFTMGFSPNAIIRNEQSASLELSDFERLKDQFSNGIFKGL